MPVLLTETAQFDLWLHGSDEDAMTLAKPYPSKEMRIVQEGFEKNDLLA